jgi:hypothetical protein
MTSKTFAPLVVFSSLLMGGIALQASGSTQQAAADVRGTWSGTFFSKHSDIPPFTKDAWMVVDSKTERELEKELQHYKRQVGLCAAAASGATGKSASAILMSV